MTKTNSNNVSEIFRNDVMNGDKDEIDEIELINWLTHAYSILSSTQCLQVSDITHTRHTNNCGKYWNSFYQNNTCNFFKDRHWTIKTFPTELSPFTPHTSNDSSNTSINEVNINELDSSSNRRYVLLEVGCGVGNFFFPLLADLSPIQRSSVFVSACDFSRKAVELIHNHPLYDPSYLNAFVSDISLPNCFEYDYMSSLSSSGSASVITPMRKELVRLCSVDVCSMIFVLGAIMPEKHITVLRNIDRVLKPGGKVIFRDYAILDHAHVRFHTNRSQNLVSRYSYPSQASSYSSVVGEDSMDTSNDNDESNIDNVYLRTDGTLSYFFSKPQFLSLIASVGWEVDKCWYVYRRIENRKTGVVMYRVFLEGVFRKPSDASVDGMKSELVDAVRDMNI